MLRDCCNLENYLRRYSEQFAIGMNQKFYGKKNVCNVYAKIDYFYFYQHQHTMQHFFYFGIFLCT